MLVILLAVAVSGPAAQTAVGQSSSRNPVNPLPDPYSPDEFPDWANSLRRFEIVSLGSFPILLFYSRIALDLGRFAGNGFDASYAPWPFRNEFSYKPDNSEQWLAVKVAFGLSLGVGVLDYFLVSRRKARQQVPVDTIFPDSLRP
jgi:hypothetical protein